MVDTACHRRLQLLEIVQSALGGSRDLLLPKGNLLRLEDAKSLILYTS